MLTGVLLIILCALLAGAMYDGATRGPDEEN